MIKKYRSRYRKHLLNININSEFCSKYPHDYLNVFMMFLHGVYVYTHVCVYVCVDKCVVERGGESEFRMVRMKVIPTHSVH